ncbi:zinc-ribbon domain-containing protein [Ligaoa zhengdingensis]
MRYCERCGNSVGEDAGYCSKCGAKLRSGAEWGMAPCTGPSSPNL